MMASEQTSHKILLFPFLAQGHLTPFFELAKNLSKHNFVVYFCSTLVNLKPFSRELDDHSIIPLEFHLQSSPELPPHYHTTRGLPSHLKSSLIDALHNNLGPSFSNILKTVQPDLVIYDIGQTWLPPLAASYNIPAVFFQTIGATPQSYYMHLVKRPDLEFPSTAIFYREYEMDSFQVVKSMNKSTDEDYMSIWIENSNEIILIRSSRAFEEKYIDFQSILVDKNVVSLGSLVSDLEGDLDDDSKIIQWLNEKEEASTVYVSFGSEVCLTNEELKEIALGLEISNVNFIWVVRSPHGYKTRLEEVMPEGFLDKIEGKGVIEDGWAPQTKILKHPSIGAFVSHCGWGSCVESISFGVPIIAMPMQYDQHLNARLVAELGVGLEVVREENGHLDGKEIARIIEEVLLKDDGEVIRKNSRELGKKVRVKSEDEVDAAVQELRRICQKKNL